MEPCAAGRETDVPCMLVVCDMSKVARFICARNTKGLVQDFIAVV